MGLLRLNVRAWAPWAGPRPGGSGVHPAASAAHAPDDFGDRRPDLGGTGIADLFHSLGTLASRPHCILAIAGKDLAGQAPRCLVDRQHQYPLALTGENYAPGWQ